MNAWKLSCYFSADEEGLRKLFNGVSGLFGDEAVLLVEPDVNDERHTTSLNIAKAHATAAYSFNPTLSPLEPVKE